MGLGRAHIGTPQVPVRGASIPRGGHQKLCSTHPPSLARAEIFRLHHHPWRRSALHDQLGAHHAQGYHISRRPLRTRAHLRLLKIAVPLFSLRCRIFLAFAEGASDAGQGGTKEDALNRQFVRRGGGGLRSYISRPRGVHVARRHVAALWLSSFRRRRPLYLLP